MKDLDSLFSGLLGFGLGRGHGRFGGLAGGLLGSVLLRRNARRFGRDARLGALAAIGSLAYRAWSEARAGTGSSGRRIVRDETIVVPGRVAADEALPYEPPPADSGFVPRDPVEAEQLGSLLLRAMIAAAHADGRLDGRESERIRREVDGLDLDPEDRALLLEELRRPVGIEALAAATRTPEQAAEVYAASLLAIEVDSALERSHLRRLAAALGLEDAVVERLEAHALGA